MSFADEITASSFQAHLDDLLEKGDAKSLHRAATMLNEKATGKSGLDAFETHDMLVSATRYYIGRMTISTTWHARMLAQVWPDLPEHVRKTIRRSLDQAFKRDDAARERKGTDRSGGLPLGMDCDRAAWEEVRNAWEAMEANQ